MKKKFKNLERVLITIYVITDDEFNEENYNNFATDKEISPYSAEHQFQLTKALAVLHIKPSTFHSYYTSGKYDKVCIPTLLFSS